MVLCGVPDQHYRPALPIGITDRHYMACACWREVYPPTITMNDSILICSLQSQGRILANMSRRACRLITAGKRCEEHVGRAFGADATTQRGKTSTASSHSGPSHRTTWITRLSLTLDVQRPLVMMPPLGLKVSRVVPRRPRCDARTPSLATACT